MPDQRPLTLLCLASYFKGGAFLRMARQLGCKVILITRETMVNEDWPRESIDELYDMPDLRKRPDILYTVSYLARTHVFDQVIALDDFDVETAGALRDHLCLPGLSESQARHFRDKLAMRTLAAAAGVPVPAFTSVVNYARLSEFMQRIPPPWLLKPRSEASSRGITTIQRADEIWPILESLGDQQSYFLLEQFIPGEVFHVDGLVLDGELIFADAHRYTRPPMSVYQGGGVFATRTLERGSELRQALIGLDRQVLQALGATWGATHVEFIRAQAGGQLYFLECANRVGGANIAEAVEFATGVNLWAEWARIEVAQLRGEPYRLPETRPGYAGVMNCLARQEYPDLSAYQDPEVVWRLSKRYHAGLILASPDSGRLQQLLDEYSQRFSQDFLAVLPPLEKSE